MWSNTKGVGIWLVHGYLRSWGWDTLGPLLTCSGGQTTCSPHVLWMELGRQVLAESINLRIIIGGLSNSALCETQGVRVNGMWLHIGALDRM